MKNLIKLTPNDSSNRAELMNSEKCISVFRSSSAPFKNIKKLFVMYFRYNVE